MAATAASFNLVGSFRGISLGSSSSSSFLKGDSGSLYLAKRNLLLLPLRAPLTIQNARKKGAGSTKNGRDSKGQRLGVKVYGTRSQSLVALSFASAVLPNLIDDETLICVIT